MNILNFVIEPQFNPFANATHEPRILNMPAHINAQGDYARAATKLFEALLPDLADDVAGRPFPIEVSDSGNCPALPTLPAYDGRPAVDFRQQNSVVARAVRQRWTDPSTDPAAGSGEVFCAFVVVANLCPAPSPFTLRLLSGALATSGIDSARHQFDANYNVPLVRDADTGSDDAPSLSLSDVVGGYGTSVLRLGCTGWKEACDGSGRVC